MKTNQTPNDLTSGQKEILACAWGLAQDRWDADTNTWIPGRARWDDARHAKVVDIDLEDIGAFLGNAAPISMEYLIDFIDLTRFCIAFDIPFYICDFVADHRNEENFDAAVRTRFSDADGDIAPEIWSIQMTFEVMKLEKFHDDGRLEYQD